jgi:tetratricopeptide (TPR) repeat protein
MPTAILTPAEEAQLGQTIEMFEVITQSQPNDYQSLEILKEAYTKLGREQSAVSASKRIAKAYLEMGQLSSAILEYETILQRCPEDLDVQAALKKIETKASSLRSEGGHAEPGNGEFRSSHSPLGSKTSARAEHTGPLDDGHRVTHKFFVDTKLISAGDFEQCWPKVDLSSVPEQVQEPFVGILNDRGILPFEKSLKLISDKSRCAYLSLATYDLDMDLARTFTAETCRRWCVLPFDRMSKSILVATTNPFNQQAAKELASQTRSRLLWYLVPPADLIKNIQRAFR